MTYNEIRKMAIGMGIKTYRMKKSDLVRGIQKTESNIECYGTERVDYCNEHECLWRNDCLSLNSNKKVGILYRLFSPDGHYRGSTTQSSG